MDHKVYSNEILYRQKFPIKYLATCIFLLLLGIIYLLFFTAKYDVLETKGYISCTDECKVTVTSGVDDYMLIQNASKVYIGNKEINVKSVQVSDVSINYETYESYRNIELKLSKKVDFDDEIVSLNILCNKKTLINKLNPFKKGG